MPVIGFISARSPEEIGEPMSPIGTKRTCRAELTMSVDGGIVLKKSFWGDDQNFSGLLMRFARGDMRDHIVSHKNDHGASYERYGVLPWWSRVKISFYRCLSSR